jgi:hypothetical protein
MHWYKKNERLQPRTVNNLHVNDQLTAIVIDDQGTDAATTRVESLSQSRPKVGLVKDGKGLLDITGLSHGDNYSPLVHNK